MRARVCVRDSRLSDAEVGDPHMLSWRRADYYLRHKEKQAVMYYTASQVFRYDAEALADTWLCLCLL